MTEKSLKVAFNETCVIYVTVISSVSLVFGKKGKEMLLKESILDWHCFYSFCFAFLVSHVTAIPD